MTRLFTSFDLDDILREDLEEKERLKKEADAAARKERIDVLRQSAFLPTEYFDRAGAFYRGENPTNSFYIWQLINLSFFLK